jgi:hypothetical protein
MYSIIDIVVPTLIVKSTQMKQKLNTLSCIRQSIARNLDEYIIIKSNYKRIIINIKKKNIVVSDSETQGNYSSLYNN